MDLTAATYRMMSEDRNSLDQPVGSLLPDWAVPLHPDKAVIEGEWCRLEPLDPARHAASLYAANMLDEDGLNWTYLPYGPFSSAVEYTSWMRQVCLGKDPLFFAMIESSTQEALGVASYLRIKPECGSIEVGHINYSPRLQRTRAATEAMFLMMEHAFELGYRRYEWKCHALNAPSRMAAQRLGFSFEGIFRQATVVKGRNRDTAWFSIIDSEWPMLKEAYASWLSPTNFDEEGKQRVRLSDLTRPILKAVFPS